MAGPREESVFFATWAQLPEPSLPSPSAEAAVAINWEKVLEVRAALLRELERLRVAERIGAPLDASVDLYCAPGLLDGLRPLGDELRFALIVSAARVPDAVAGEGFALGADGQPQLWIVAQPSTATKCVRCWHKRDDVGAVATHPELCARCASNVDGPGETRRWA
jgi:isoleucyl-tRNA synthetase